ncbi:MAG: hypothetical protein K6G22_00345 [Lachnospiraceae bacterium]|nr:hypothetical protein [Lachnospiraceae bacterium]
MRIKEDKTDELISELDKLIGAEELKQYVKNTCRMYKRFDDSNIDILYNRALLLSINEGDGRSTWKSTIKNMWKMLLDLYDISVKDYVMKPPAIEDAANAKKTSDRDIVLNKLDSDYVFESMFDDRRILFLDITKWVDNVSGDAFRAVLSRLEASLEEQFVVFVIPAVDDNTLKNIKEAISWFMNVDEIYCPPYGIEEYTEYGLKRFEAFGVKIEDGVEEMLAQIIAGLRRDYQFNGFKSVRAVVDDIMIKNIFKNTETA